MADDRKYYYLKVKDDFFNDDAMIILQRMPDGYLYSDILMKLYLKSLKNSGKLMFNDLIPYTPDILAQLVNHQIGTVEKALDVFEKLGLVEILDNGAIFMLNIQNFIGKSSTEADRKREYRARIEQEKQQLLCDTGQMSRQMTGQNSPEIEIEKEIEIDIEKEVEPEGNKAPPEVKKIDYQLIADMYNDTCVSFPRVQSLSEKRKKAIKARLKQYTVEDFKTLFTKAEASSFLKGGNDRDWSANFDWLIMDGNMAKVLSGNYDNKPKKPAAVTKSAAAYNNYSQRQRSQNDYDALERMLLNQQSPPDTAGNNPDIQARAEALQERLRG